MLLLRSSARRLFSRVSSQAERRLSVGAGEAADGATPKQDSKRSEEEVRSAILKSALQHVPHLGWSTKAIRQGCIDEGISPSATSIIRGGAGDLVHYFMDSASRQTLDSMAEMPLKDLRQTAVVREAIKRRLLCHKPYLRHWTQAMAIGALPSNSLQTMRCLALFFDDVCALTGDRSIDLAWYGKRLAVGSIYTSTELYMLTDRSENFADSWQFLERRIENAVNCASIPQQFSRYANEACRFIFKGAASLAASAPFPKSPMA